ncbi:hypothetical protein U879_15105 [Defluviimonas sp. 20V17]|uniref:Uncharacterized protein n=1 Tax=Allgaiera indica TaxID=765699 RepID=A0AAN4ZZ32_9RHOB|nr:hypothetical protein [Allgaiera indica]KDB02874.1 hypothetical protein U879_15105 [Defluviimonas sp. 20V17]GHE01318.1 hypothetical protein GCM10008024_16310 [Allgaiera indica]SDW84650.1 hypothetical protein SAMN05444006_10793 [Allgaiera indica]
MLDATREPPRCTVTEADRLADPTAPWAMMIRWLETQRQDVWGRMILGADTDLAGAEGLCLLWMIRCKMDRANAIRLFWRLFRPELYLRPADAGPLPEADAATLAALRAIVSRFGVSAYPTGQLGLGRAEARYYRLRFRAGLAALGGRRARRNRQAAFEIPPAFFQPLPGRALEAAPTMRPVGPMPAWMGTESEAAFHACGVRLRQMVSGEAGHRFGAEMRAGLRAARRAAMIRVTAGGVTAVAAMVQVSGGDMGRLLHLIHLPIG